MRRNSQAERRAEEATSLKVGEVTALQISIALAVFSSA